MPCRGGIEELQSLVRSHGFEFETHPVEEPILRSISDELALPQSFSSLYTDHGPTENTTIPWVVEEISIFSFGELPAAQDGYRWIGPGRTPSPSWPGNWVVVASVFDDPFFIDTSIDACPVFFARHGAGTWDPTEIASSMQSFIQGLACFESVLLDGFDLDVWDGDGLRPDFVGEVKRRLADMLTAEQASAFVALLA